MWKQTVLVAIFLMASFAYGQSVPNAIMPENVNGTLTPAELQQIQWEQFILDSYNPGIDFTAEIKIPELTQSCCLLEVIVHPLTGEYDIGYYSTRYYPINFSDSVPEADRIVTVSSLKKNLGSFALIGVIKCPYGNYYMHNTDGSLPFTVYTFTEQGVVTGSPQAEFSIKAEGLPSLWSKLVKKAKMDAKVSPGKVSAPASTPDTKVTNGIEKKKKGKTSILKSFFGREKAGY